MKFSSVIFLGLVAVAAAFVAPSSSAKPSSSLSSTTALDEPTTIAEIKCEAGGTILDEAKMISAQNFPISPEELVAKAKAALVKDSGVLDPSLWADDFEFCAPYVGPLSKQEFFC